MKYFCKYWWLFWKYQDLRKKYEELVDLVDNEFWKEVLSE